MRWVNTLLVLNVIATGLACRPTLQGDLQEGEANELVATLLEANIPADKHAQGSGRFAVAVAGEDISAAWSLLRSRGLPRRRHQGLREVFSERGLVPGRLEEQAIFIGALQEEISRTLEEVEGVTFARVHLTAALGSERGKEAAPPAASVLMGFRRSSGPPLDPAQVRELVAHTVAGLSPDRVAVVAVPSPTGGQPATPARIAAPANRAGMVAGLAAALAAGGLGLWLRRRRYGAARKVRLLP